MDSIRTTPISTSDMSTEDAMDITSGSSPFENIVEKIDMAVDKVAKERNLETCIVRQRLPPIDIFVFGRSGIGKSQLIKAITNLDIATSSQIDHVTHALTMATTTIEELQFRFWDTKGFDNWLDIDAVENLFNEMQELKIQPIFIIYCAASGGRVDSDIVAAILKRFQLTKKLICYVITNIYAASDDQLEKQKEGGFRIMNHIFETVPDETGEFCYEYRHGIDRPDASIPDKRGILIGVNSCPFRNRMGSMAIYNIHELMNFLAGNLSDEDFSKFVAITMNNRDFWDRCSDAFATRLQRATDILSRWKIQIVSFFEWLF